MDHAMHAEVSVQSRTATRLISVVVGTLLLAGCGGIRPTPIEQEELSAIAKADRAAAVAEVEPLKGALTLEEAIARALKYNLERRSRMMEEAIALNQLDVSEYDMLPRLIAQAGYHTRNQDTITRSKDSVTGLPSLANPFISSSRDATLYDLGMTWNLLDFGASYYGAKQNADRVLVAMERRRKAMHVLIQDVRSAFWRAASAQKLQQQVLDAISLAEEALKDARQAENERVRSPVESLRYQRQVLENLRLLESTNRELATARLELAHLINLPLTASVDIAEPSDEVSHRMLDVPVERLEDLAVGRNADLRENFYNARIAREETRRVLLRLFPGVSFNYDLKYNTDAYMVNQRWNEAGASISFNLFNLLSGPAQMRLAEAGVAIADQRRMASQMAILAQVHIARLQYSNALNQYERANAVSNVDKRIEEIVSKREQAQVQSKLDAVANKTTSILSLLRRYQALADAHTAASRLQATLGVEPEFDSMSALTLAQLTGIVSKAIKAWDAGDLPGATVAAKPDETAPKQSAPVQKKDDATRAPQAVKSNVAEAEAPHTLAGAAPAVSSQPPSKPDAAVSSASAAKDAGAAPDAPVAAQDAPAATVALPYVSAAPAIAVPTDQAGIGFKPVTFRYEGEHSPARLPGKAVRHSR